MATMQRLLLTSSRASSRIRICRSLPRHQHIPPARAFSLWGSSAKSTPEPSPPSPSPQADLLIKDPSELDAPTRAIKASEDVAADTSFVSQAPNAFEPQRIEDAQQSLLPPHGDGAGAGAAGEVTMPLEEIPERIGYLKEACGLDFGWGPSSMMEWILEHIHIWGGISWTASIVLLGIGLRASLFPTLVMSAAQSARMRSMMKELKPIQEQYKEAMRVQNQNEMSRLQVKMRVTREEYGVSLKKAFAPMFLQIPLGFGCWRILRNAALLPVPGFVTESWLWTNDLTFGDPYYILPALSAALVWGTFRVNRKAAQGSAAMGGQAQTAILQKVFPIVSFVFTAVQPGAVQLYFLSSSATGLVSAMIMQNGVVRRSLGLPTIDEVRNAGDEPTDGSSGAAAAAAAAAPKATHGMRIRSFEAQRTLEAKARVLKEEEEAERKKERSYLDRGVDGVKQWGSSTKGTVSKAFESFAGNQEERAARNKQEARERYEAQARLAADEQRRERNRRLGYDEEERRRD